MTEKLTILELNAARELLHRVDMLVADARSLFFDIEDCTTVARLKNIERRLQDEVQSVERLMAIRMGCRPCIPREVDQIGSVVLACDREKTKSKGGRAARKKSMRSFSCTWP